MRKEHDFLGELEVPDNVYYGVQTMRAIENFSITGRKLDADFIVSMAMVKKAAAQANMETGRLDKKIGNALVQAAEEIIDGEFLEQFPVDPIQGGAGTSINMNMNEVLCNRALEIIGEDKGRYDIISPNNHANMAQSTNDVFPSAGKLAALRMTEALLSSLDRLIAAFDRKAKENAKVLKLGRTQLQDAVPMYLGQEFKAHADALRRCANRILRSRNELFELNLGATAIGTSINASDGYLSCVMDILADLIGQPVKAADDLIDATQNADSFAAISSAVKNCALVMSKIANDMRLLSSGPCGGIEELQLPARQPGSSIMPGKINPVIPEVVTQAAFLVAGNDVTISMAVEAGQLELNAFEPVIFYCLFESLEVLTHAADTFRERCVEGILTDEKHCSEMLMKSTVIATALCPEFGYERATQIVKKAQAEHRTVLEAAQEELSIPRETLEQIINDCLRERN